MEAEKALALFAALYWNVTVGEVAALAKIDHSRFTTLVGMLGAFVSAALTPVVIFLLAVPPEKLSGA